MQNNDNLYRFAYVLSNGNIEKRNKITYLPIYMIMFIKNNREDKSQIINLDISKLV